MTTPPDPSFSVKRLHTGDLDLLRQLTGLFASVFESQQSTPAPQDHLEKMLARKDFIALVIMYDSGVVGGLTAYELPMYEGAYAELYIYDMAVATQHRRKGLGKQLIGALKQVALEQGCRELFVEAHEEDSHALAFYRSAGGRAEKVVHFNFSAGQ